MTVRDGKLIIETLPPRKCEYCGKNAETRPYGRKGEEICITCGMLPENYATTCTQYYKQLDEVNEVIYKGQTLMKRKPN